MTEKDKPSERIEDKFKLSLLQIEKRFVDLEVALGELSEKLKGLDVTAIADLKQRVDDIEDLIMVEQAGVLELKKMLEEAQKRAEAQTAATVSSEEVEKIASEVVAKWDERFVNIEKKLATLEISRTLPEGEELKKQIQLITNQLKNLESAFNSEIEYIKEKMITEDLIQTIVSEISELRTEHGREIREIKEKIGSAPLYADIQFLSNRVKDLKIAVDNLLNMKIEIDSKILNLERSLAETEAKPKIPSSLEKEIENIRIESATNNKKLLSLEKAVQEVSKKFESLDVGEVGKKLETIGEIENLYTKINEIYSDLQRKVEGISKITPINIDEKIRGLEEKIDEIEHSIKDLENKIAKQEIPSRVSDAQIKELTEKIISLEMRLKILERIVEQPTKAGPIILE